MARDDQPETDDRKGERERKRKDRRNKDEEAEMPMDSADELYMALLLDRDERERG